MLRRLFRQTGFDGVHHRLSDVVFHVVFAHWLQNLQDTKSLSEEKDDLLFQEANQLGEGLETVKERKDEQRGPTCQQQNPQNKK